MLAAFAVMSIAFVATASAHTVKSDTKVTAKYTPGNSSDETKTARFDGTVTSDKQRCQENREVLVKLRQGDDTFIVGTDITDAEGNWSTTQPPGSVYAPGEYFAVAPKKVLRDTARHLHVCQKDVSREITVK